MTISMRSTGEFTLPASARCSLLAALVRAHVAAQTDVAREMQAAESGRAVSLPTSVHLKDGTRVNVALPVGVS